MTMTKRTLTEPRTYRVVYERDETGLWLARIQGVPGCHTQGRTLAQARERIREALSLFDDHAPSARLEDDVRLPVPATRLVHAQRQARSRQAAMEVRLRELTVKAAGALTRQGLSLRDTGELLGVSQESVRQWLRVS
jgi:predicted RNase H-like HicB family nuclease